MAIIINFTIHKYIRITTFIYLFFTVITIEIEKIKKIKVYFKKNSIETLSIVSILFLSLNFIQEINLLN